jgi:hypothetical protein
MGGSDRTFITLNMEFPQNGIMMGAWDRIDSLMLRSGPANHLKATSKPGI